MAVLKTEFENGTFIGRSRRDDSKFQNRTAGKCRRKWLPDVGVRFLSFVLLMASCHCYQEQRFAMEPQDQSAIVGSRVTLPCRVENKAGILQWTKDDFGLGTQRNLTGYERYSMIGSDEEGDYSLDIRDVTLEDDGVYRCQVSSGLNGEPEIRSRYAQLIVLVAPDPPRIIQGAFIDATEEQEVDIECVSEGGKPASEITWLDGNQAVIKKQVSNKIEDLPDGKRFKTRSVLRLMPSKLHHNQTITCQAQNTADRAPRMATVHIEVKYAPKINITITSGNNGRIPEGSEVRIKCDVDANPLPQVYRWYLNNNPVIGDYTDEMIIFNATRKHNKAAVRCEVSNSVGKSEEKVTLDVTYPPTFRTRPQNIEAEIGSSVTLSCDVDGQPPPEIRWLLHEPGRIGVKGKAPNLRVYVNNSTAGRYICKATVEGYAEIESEATIFIKGPPKILSNRTQFGSEGDSARIECIALSVPKPDDIRWYFEGKEISVIHDPDYATLEETLSDGTIKSSLVIRASQSRHYGLYNCSITNEYGNANSGIVLKPLKTLPLFIILIGVTSGIILFSAFIILVVICHRRRRNTQISEKPDVTVTGDMYKESDRSSNISDLKLGLPQSDGSYELDYTSSERSDSKPPVGLPLAGPVALPPNMRHDDPLLQFRYSNDYSDPAYNDAYFKQPPAAYIYDYPQGYAPPPNLRVQSPADIQGNRSLQGSLTRSIDTASTLPLSAGNNSASNSLQRTKNDETDAINNLGLPVGGDNTPPAPIYAQPHNKNQGVDLRYAATYGNPYLRNSSLGYGVHTAKPAATPAPPPYSARGSVVPSGIGKSAQATHV